MVLILSKTSSKKKITFSPKNNINFIRDYRDICGDELIEKLYEEANPLVDKHIDHINSTLYGGGVSQLLNSLVILMNELGMRVEWHVIKGTSDFFVLTNSL